MNRRIAFAIVLACPIVAVADDNVYKKALKSTVWIMQESSREGNRINFRTGSGALIDVQKKLVLTNHHVVGGKPSATVFFPMLDRRGNLVPEREKYMEMKRAGGGINAKVLLSDATRDLAILQLDSVPRGAPALRLAKESPSPGDRVHSIGSPGVSGALFNYTGGDVKSVYQKTIRFTPTPEDPKGMVLNARIIETNSSTNKGDSGGPLMNDRAELVGVAQSIVGGNDAFTRPVSIFVDLSEIKALLKQHRISLSNAPAATVASDDSDSKKPEKAAATSAPKSKKQMESEADAKLNGARLFLSSNKKLAGELLQELIEQYPMTTAAAEAKKLLEKLK